MYVPTPISVNGTSRRHHRQEATRRPARLTHTGGGREAHCRQRRSRVVVGGETLQQGLAALEAAVVRQWLLS